MTWHITILSADGRRMIFHGTTRDTAELQTLATEARRQRADVQILIRQPNGQVYSWD